MVGYSGIIIHVPLMHARDTVVTTVIFIILLLVLFNPYWTPLSLLSHISHITLSIADIGLWHVGA